MTIQSWNGKPVLILAAWCRRNQRKLLVKCRETLHTSTKPFHPIPCVHKPITLILVPLSAYTRYTSALCSHTFVTVHSWVHTPIKMHPIMQAHPCVLRCSWPFYPHELIQAQNWNKKLISNNNNTYMAQCAHTAQHVTWCVILRVTQCVTPTTGFGPMSLSLTNWLMLKRSTLNTPNFSTMTLFCKHSSYRSWKVWKFDTPEKVLENEQSRFSLKKPWILTSSPWILLRSRSMLETIRKKYKYFAAERWRVCVQIDI